MGDVFDNLKNLSSPAMVAATKGWVEEGEAREALMSVPETAGCLSSQPLKLAAEKASQKSKSKEQETEDSGEPAAEQPSTGA